MEFKVLGPLEVINEGKPVFLSSGREIIALACLLLEANNIVPVDRLIDSLWGDDPPRTAKNQVQIIISALRQKLGDDLIKTRSPGYVVRVSADLLDLSQFNSLARIAARATAEQRFAEAVDHLRLALSLWRGDAVEGAESGVIRTMAMRLNERRISVLQDCLDLELRLGRHHRIISELTELVAQHPLNERFRAYLMLALYRSGRQMDALEVFWTGRKILQEDLGLDPAQELRDLEQAILTHDPELEPPGKESPGQAAESQLAPPVPHQLPRAIVDFTGREEALNKVCQVLAGDAASNSPPSVPVIVLAGCGGAGKTALAVQAAHMLRAQFPDGQLFLQFRNDKSRSVLSLLDYQLRSFGLSSHLVTGNLEGLAGTYRSWLANRRILVVIDGAATPSQAVPLVPGYRGCAAIITSRRCFTSIEGAIHLGVGPLDGPSAYSLLTGLIGEERVAGEEHSARELVRLCEGLPLALRIAAAKLVATRNWQISTMVSRLQDEERRLDELEFDGAGVRTTLALTYESLDSRARQLFRYLSLLGTGDFPFWVGVPLLDQNIDVAEDLLNALVRLHLIEISVADDRTISFHLRDLVRIYATECLLREESGANRLAAKRRLSENLRNSPRTGRPARHRG